MITKYASQFPKDKYKGIEQGMPPILINNFNSKEHFSASFIPKRNFNILKKDSCGKYTFINFRKLQIHMQL